MKIITHIDKELEATLDALAFLFGAKGYTLKKSACGGDWAGTWDYFVDLDGVGRLFLGNGLKHAKTGASEALNQIQYLRAHKEENERLILDVLQRKYPAVESVTVDVSDYSGDGTGDLSVWAVLRITLCGFPGFEFLYRETGMSYALRCEDGGKDLFNVARRAELFRFDSGLLSVRERKVG